MIFLDQYNNLVKEFEAKANDYVTDGTLTLENKDDWHFHLFNEDYYVIGYYNAAEKLKEHNIDAFDAISTCIEYEKENFGEVSKTYSNAEETTNMLMYILGEKWINEKGSTFIEELLNNNQ